MNLARQFEKQILLSSKHSQEMNLTPEVSYGNLQPFAPTTTGINEQFQKDISIVYSLINHGLQEQQQLPTPLLSAPKDIKPEFLSFK